MHFSEHASFHSLGMDFLMKKRLWRILSQLSLELCGVAPEHLASDQPQPCISSTLSTQIFCSGLDSYRLLFFPSLVHFQNRHSWEVWGWHYQGCGSVLLASPWYMTNQPFLNSDSWFWDFWKSSIEVGVFSPADTFLQSTASKPFHRCRAIFMLAGATEWWWNYIHNSPLEI